jgi:hypothetical protein
MMAALRLWTSVYGARYSIGISSFSRSRMVLHVMLNSTHIMRSNAMPFAEDPTCINPVSLHRNILQAVHVALAVVGIFINLVQKCDSNNLVRGRWG